MADSTEEDKEEAIKNAYYQPAGHGSFTSPHKFYKSLSVSDRKLYGSESKIKDVLLKDDVYPTTRKAVRKYRRQRVIVPYRNYMWDADCAYMSEIKIYNEPYIGFMVAIDIYSKFLRTCLLTRIIPEQIIECFKKFFVSAKPEYCRHDAGGEYIAFKTQNFLKSQGVRSITTSTEKKANFAERVILTVKLKIARYLKRYNTNVWHNVLADVTESYNNSYHSTIKMNPADVTQADEYNIWVEMYENPYLKGRIKKPYAMNYKYAINDVVSISKLRSTFHRGWHENFTNELFVVVERRVKQGLPLYKIKDMNNTVIAGSFQEQELQMSRIDYDNYDFKIEKIVKRKGNKVLVSWKGWPSKFDSWILKSSVKDL